MVFTFSLYRFPKIDDELALYIFLIDMLYDGINIYNKTKLILCYVYFQTSFRFPLRFEYEIIESLEKCLFIFFRYQGFCSHMTVFFTMLLVASLKFIFQSFKD